MSESSERTRHRERFPHRFGSRLFTLRNEDGDWNKLLAPILRQFQRELGSQKGFIGLGPIGSAVLGYATEEPHGHHNERSDVDIAIFYDSSVQSSIDQRLEHIFTEEREDLFNSGLSVPPIHLPGTDRYDLDANRVRDFLSALRDKGFDALDDHDNVKMFRAIAKLAGIVVGPHVETYRERIGAQINQLESSVRAALIDELAYAQVAWETRMPGDRKAKMHERMFPNASEQQLDEMRSQRFLLWKARIEKAYGVAPATNS